MNLTARKNIVVLVADIFTHKHSLLLICLNHIIMWAIDSKTFHEVSKSTM